MAKDVKISMITAASSALKYHNEKKADLEESLKFVMKNLSSKGDNKLAEIAAVNHVLKFKESKPKASEKEVMQSLSDNIDKILKSIKNQDMNIGKLF